MFRPRLSLLIISWLLAGLFAGAFGQPLPVAAARNGYSIAGNRFVDRNGKPVFLFGINYEGNGDRAWLMWDDRLFDPALIESNLALAAEAGINTVRIFIQPSLRDSINYGDWGKLDKVVEIATRHGLTLLVTFHDYSEYNLAAEADFERRVAAHYAGNPVILGYDLRNELQFGEIAATRYPAGQESTLQKPDLLRIYGERLSQSKATALRGTVPSHLDAQQSYYVLNVLKLWDEFQQAVTAWSVAHTGLGLPAFLNSPEAGYWQPLLDATNTTLANWLQVKIAAIHSADQDALVTVGWNNPLLAALPANSGLSFISMHSFPPEGFDGLNATLNNLESLRTRFPNLPVVLEEFGYSNTRFDGSPVAQTESASYETALWLSLYQRGFAGCYKWMLTNWPVAFNRFEGGLGLLDDNDRPKLSYYLLKALSSFARSENGLRQQIFQPDGSNLNFYFSASNALFSSAPQQTEGPVTYTQSGYAPFAAWWSAGEINLVGSSQTQVTLDLDRLFPGRNRQQTLRLLVNGADNGQQVPDISPISLNIAPGAYYKLILPDRPAALDAARSLGGSTLYFKATGHNLGGIFRTYWENNGGLSMFGYPLSEEFTEQNPQDGKLYTVQYFERARFENHPENRGTAYEVLLGHLGRTITAGRESETPFRSVLPDSAGANRLYFKENGHTLGGSFRLYWEKNGGLARFGFPISEEFAETNPADGKIYTVQYFERTRFEYHPENSGTVYEVLLGLIGWQVLKNKNWL